jgi:hypothetical protein
VLAIALGQSFAAVSSSVDDCFRGGRGRDEISPVTYLVSMPLYLKQSIEEIFSRTQGAPFVPCLTLKGSDEREREKFPMVGRLSLISGRTTRQR